MERCRREIASIEAEILAGNPDLPGLCLALSDWSAELRILQDEVRRNENTQSDEMLPMPAGPPLHLHIMAVDSEGKETLAHVFEVPQTIPTSRRWRTTRWPRAR